MPPMVIHQVSKAYKVNLKLCLFTFIKKAVTSDHDGFFYASFW